MHGIGNAVQEINDAEKPDKTPTLQSDIKGQIDDHRGCQYSNYEPWFEFTPACSCPFNNIPHDGVIQCIKDSRGNHDCRNCRELSCGEIVREKNEGQQITCDKIIYHVSPDGSERKHDQIFLSDFRIIHICPTPLSFWYSIIRDRHLQSFSNLLFTVKHAMIIIEKVLKEVCWNE